MTLNHAIAIIAIMLAAMVAWNIHWMFFHPEAFFPRKKQQKNGR